MALVVAHLWLEGAVNSPLLGDLFRAVPETNSDTCEIGGTKSCGLSNLWTLNSNTEDIGLELHQQVVDNSTTINTQRLQTGTAIGFHCLQYVTGLVTHGLQRCTSNMTNSRAASQTDDSTTCVGIPVRSAETNEGRDEIDAAVVGDGVCQRLYVNTVLNNLQTIA